MNERESAPMQVQQMMGRSCFSRHCPKIGSGNAVKGASFAFAISLCNLVALSWVELLLRQSLRFFAVHASHFNNTGDRHGGLLRALSKKQILAKHQRLSQRRIQQEVDGSKERPCGSMIDVISTDEVVQMATTFISSMLTPTEFPSVMEPIITAAQYDLQVVKVCGTCDSLVGLHPTTFNTEKEHTLFQSYCGPESYGVADGIVHSAIALVPLEAADSEEGSRGRIPVLGKLKSLINMRATLLDVNDAPTVSWPDRFDSVLGNTTNEQAELIFNYWDFFAAVASASTGAVAIFPDGVGT
jgi:hypothetical protein